MAKWFAYKFKIGMLLYRRFSWGQYMATILASSLSRDWVAKLAQYRVASFK